MKSEWLNYNGNDKLIIFCNGWGMDAEPFKPLECGSYDVLLCYDYSEDIKAQDIPKLAEVYHHLYLVGWSMGVVYAQKYFAGVADYFTKKIAINGTLKPIDDQFGIPVNVCQATLEALDEVSLVKFYRRMCRSDSVFEKFMANCPRRGVADQKEELSAIISDSQIMEEKDSIYTHVVISDNDRIVPTANQKRFWHEGNVVSLQSSHFPFYLWNSWDELLNVGR